jgi:hypothetical protein
MKKNILLLFICRFLVCSVFAQSPIGTPHIKSYTQSDYNAGNEIWDINQDKSGIVYFANDEGLLSFDGTHWKTYTLPNKSAIKSLAIDQSGRIFVGGQDEIGYFFPDEKGILKFHSIKLLLPTKARQFADIWSIVLYNNEVFFRTIECIFEYKNNHIKTFDAPGGWRLLAKAGSQLFAEDKDVGLKVFKNGNWQNCNGGLPNAALHVTGLMDYKADTLLVTTIKDGLFLLHGSTLTKKATYIDAALNNDLVNCAKKIDADRYAIGTTARGVFIIDSQGKLIDHFSNNFGFHNNSILSLLQDNEKNLWVGLENGIDFINYNTSVKHIYSSAKNQLKSNTIRIFYGKLFIGTSNGLYSVPIDLNQKDISTSKGLFTEVKNTKGSVWSLNEVNHHLLIGHQDGAMVLDGNQARQITHTGQGTWFFQPIPSSPNIIAGTYTGLELLQNNADNFKDVVKVDGIYESLKDLAIDNHNVIWASHPYRGIYRLQLSADHKSIIKHKQYTNYDGLPSTLNNRAYFIKNKVIAATEKGIYEYNASTNKFIPSPFYKSIFGSAPVQYLTEDMAGNIWFVCNQHIGVIDFSKAAPGNPYNIIRFSELTGQTVKGFEFIYPYNADNVFISANNGIFHLNYSQYVKSENKLNVLLTTVKAIAEKDSLIFGGHFTKNNQIVSMQDNSRPVSLSNHWNSFHFEYSSILFAQKTNEEFSYKLIGFDRDWSAWSSKTEKDYTNLSYGKYAFSVRTRNNLGNASAPVTYSFTVEPAWYQTTWAYLLYVMVIALIIYFAVKKLQRQFDLHQKKHEEEQRRLSYLHSLELDRNEKEIIALKNNNLEAELLYKNKELASVTMYLVDRGRLLLDIKEELNSLIKKLNIPDATYHFRSIFKLLTDTEKNDNDWDQFSIYFDQVHNNFLATLKQKFPTLSSTDLKLCAYLRLNLTSKEIAQLLNISLKGIEISRYRLRKKLQLPSSINLYDFLTDITS